MTIRKIPEVFEWKCDMCGVTEEVKTERSKPTMAGKISIFQDAHDFQGHAVADGSVHLDVCRVCKSKVIAAINALNPIKKAG